MVSFEHVPRMPGALRALHAAGMPGIIAVYCGAPTDRRNLHSCIPCCPEAKPLLIHCD